jgi:hypothetical protein
LLTLPNFWTAAVSLKGDALPLNWRVHTLLGAALGKAKTGLFTVSLTKIALPA